MLYMPRMTNLEATREARGMSRNALATAIGVSRTTIIKLEEGDIEEPSYSLVMNLAEKLGVPHQSLFLPSHSTKVLQAQDGAGV